MPAPSSQTPHAWAVGDLVRVEHVPPPPLDIFAISDFGLVFGLYPNYPDDPVGIITRQGRTIRVAVDSDTIQFIQSTDCAYSFGDTTQVRRDWEAGLFMAYFAQLDDRVGMNGSTPLAE